MLLIEKAKSRTLPKEVYTEKHHIIPRSMGGNNKKENLVELTAREHFICHWLLIKMTDGEDRHKMLYAIQVFKAYNNIMDRYKSHITARVYEHYRIECARVHSARLTGKPGWKWTTEQKQAMSVKKKGTIPPNAGKPMSEEQKRKLSEARKGQPAPNKGKPMSDEQKRKLSEARKGKPLGRPAWNKGIPMSEDQKLKISLANKGKEGPWKGKVAHNRGKPMNDNLKAVLIERHLGTRTINKDGTMKKVKIDELEHWLENGWSLGRGLPAWNKGIKQF